MRTIRFPNWRGTGFASRWPRLSEPQVILPVCGAVCVGLIWASTLSLANVERKAAHKASMTSTRELVETYEAQVVRAVREIDQTLKLVDFAAEAHAPHAALKDLSRRTLLPPDMLFIVGVADAQGNVVASSRPLEPSLLVSQPETFPFHLDPEALYIGPPYYSRADRAWMLRFVRRLAATDKTAKPRGFAFVTVAASYFVSGYEQSKLGEHGLLGLMGTDRAFRVRRTGDVLSVDEAPSAKADAAFTADDQEVLLASQPPDRVVRYTAARKLFAYPLTVMVGLSQAEQMAPVEAQVGTYKWIAHSLTLLMMLAIAVLSRAGWHLTRDQQRARRSLEEEIVVRKRVEKELEHQAKYDKLTGLANRSLLNERLRQYIGQARALKSRMAVAFIDLDNFKVINDTLGHSVGDELLRIIARRLQACVRGTDLIARLGGDEFVLLLPERTSAGRIHKEDTLETDVALLVQRVLAELSKPVQLRLGNRELRPECSIGVSFFPEDGTDAETLLKHADAAMYRAKALGRHRFQYFTADVKEDLQARLELESDLRMALTRGELELAYQPQVSLATGKITGIEALVRWRHPRKGLVPPSEFIPFAEETGLIHPIGAWVLQEACAQNKAWQDAGLPAVPVAVNMSVRQCEERDIDDVVVRTLDACGLDARYLELEITESLSMENPVQSVKLLERLRETGVLLCIDDFGMGFSNLSNLKRYPVDRLKLDRSLVSGIASDAGSLAIAEAVIAMAHSLRLEIVAEGVETEAQLALLRARRCDYGQGYLFSRPVSAKTMTELLAKARLMPEMETTHIRSPADTTHTKLLYVRGQLQF